MSDGRTPEQITEEAERILNSTLFKDALAGLEAVALQNLLYANGEHADIVRRENADVIKVVRRIPEIIKAQMEAAKAKARPRPSVA